MSNLELGQILLSNNDWHRYDADWAVEGLNIVAQVIAELREKDPNGFRTLLTTNSGEEEFVNHIFEMRSYCWCDGFGIEGHEEGCPPNFIYKPTGMIITWYKHAGRGNTSNKKYPGARTWFEIIKHCIGSIE